MKSGLTTSTYSLYIMYFTEKKKKKELLSSFAHSELLTVWKPIWKPQILLMLLFCINIVVVHKLAELACFPHYVPKGKMLLVKNKIS